MNRVLGCLLFGSLLSLAITTPSTAHEIEGRVLCDGSSTPLAGITVRVVSKDSEVPFEGSDVTDGDGHYLVTLPDEPSCYNATLVLGANDVFVDPASGVFSFCTDEVINQFEFDWLVRTPGCETPPPKEGACWLTGGGRFLESGHGAPEHSWGGNVNPGCSPTAGEGGNWNHVAHDLNLHFQGRAIEVIRCGNVVGIPPGSSSPKTPFNFIEFRGTGRLKGIGGNSVNEPFVYFFARVEDRAEPGSHGQRNDAQKDRYFLHVFGNLADPAGSTLLLVDEDGDPATVDPLTVSTGNMQIHITSCDFAVDRIRSGAIAPEEFSPIASIGRAWLAPGPNPAKNLSYVRFGLPQAAEISISVFDLSGRKVVDLFEGPATAGSHVLSWDLRDWSGQRVQNGLYFMRLQTGDQVIHRTVVVRP